MSCPTDIPQTADLALRREILATWRGRLRHLADDPAFVAFGLDCWRAFDRRLPAYPVPLVPRDPDRLEWLLVAAAAWLDTCGNWSRCCLSDDLRSLVRRSCCWTDGKPPPDKRQTWTDRYQQTHTHT